MEIIFVACMSAPVLVRLFVWQFPFMDKWVGNGIQKGAQPYRAVALFFVPHPKIRHAV